MTATLVPRRAASGAAETPDAETLSVRAVLLASENREIPRAAIDLAARIAKRSGAPVHVFTIARIWGTSLGFPSPGLYPTKREWDEQRRNAEKAVARLERKGVRADANIVGTRGEADRRRGAPARLRRDRDGRRSAASPRAGELHVVAGALPGAPPRRRAGAPRGGIRGLSEPESAATFLARHPPFAGLEPAVMVF